MMNPEKGHHQMVHNQNQIDYILCSEDGEALYSQPKQDWELTVAQIMSSLLPNSDLIEESGENH